MTINIPKPDLNKMRDAVISKATNALDALRSENDQPRREEAKRKWNNTVVSIAERLTLDD